MALRRQLSGVGIRVIEVLPPLIDYTATRAERQPKMSADAFVDRVLRDIGEMDRMKSCPKKSACRRF
jgi:short-subunit dehydrogenase involved in D-alanine esterification of teichoic acids